MKSLVTKLCFMALLVGLLSAGISPQKSYAQSTGLGWDGYTRQLWRASDNHAALWVLDPNLNFYEGIQYGPISGWAPVALTTANNNYSYLLWRTTDGMECIWMLDANLNLIGYTISGANPGWTPEGLSMGTTYSYLRLIWRRYDGMSAIWSLNSALAYLGANNYGPFYGYDPGPSPEALVKKVETVSSKLPGMPAIQPRTQELAAKRLASYKRAAVAMSQRIAKKGFPTLPK